MKCSINVLLLMLYSIVSGAAGMSESSCTADCSSTFGALMGQSFLTKAYSNCSGLCVSHEDHYVALKTSSKKIFSGMKWQCVEYARRWLIENKGITFADVEYAYHIWDLKHAQTVDGAKPRPLRRFKNKVTTFRPCVGDLLIYSKKLAITGHVAVVVGVEHDSITVAEQNYFNRAWDARDYARRLLLDKDRQGRYRIFDDSLMGWMRVKVV